MASPQLDWTNEEQETAPLRLLMCALSCGQSEEASGVEWAGRGGGQRSRVKLPSLWWSTVNGLILEQMSGQVISRKNKSSKSINRRSDLDSREGLPKVQVKSAFRAGFEDGVGIGQDKRSKGESWLRGFSVLSDSAQVVLMCAGEAVVQCLGYLCVHSGHSCFLP
jgi:hypothetical protein